MFLLPAVAGLLHLSDEAFGVWAGTTIHAVPQVVAAGFAYSASAGALATLVKLVRVTLLAPFLFVVGFCTRAAAGPRFPSSIRAWCRRSSTVRGPGAAEYAGAFSGAAIPLRLCPLADLLANLGELLLTLSMAAMGLEVNVRFLAHTGGRAVLTGVGATVALCLVSLMLIRMLL